MTRALWIVLPIVVAARSSFAYSQFGGPIPAGHEFLIAESGKLVQARFPELADARKLKDKTDCGWTCKSYGTKSPAIWSAVYGNRWIDIMGFLGGVGWYRGDETKCLMAAAHLQNQLFDTHFTRSASDIGEAGRQRIIRGSIARLRDYFIKAVNAGDDLIYFLDGGTVREKYRAIRSFFYFGFALHVLEDSFSEEHAARDTSPPYTIRNVKSYLCHDGVPQHRHAPASFAPTGGSPNGDNIFKSVLKSNTVAGLKPLAKAALDASVDLWVAFMQARAEKPRAGALVDTVIAKWLQWDRTPPPAYSLNANERADCATFLPDYQQYNARRIRNCYKVTGYNATAGFTDLPPFFWRAPLLNWPDPDKE